MGGLFLIWGEVNTSYTSMKYSLKQSNKLLFYAFYASPVELVIQNCEKYLSQSTYFLIELK